MKLGSALWALFGRDLSQAWAGGGGALLPMGFFVGAVTLAPLAIGTEIDRLLIAGPGVLWIALALATLLSAERLFQGELEDGSLDLLLLSGVPGYLWALVKALAHVVATGLPLVAVTPLLWMMLRLPFEGLPLAILALILGTISFQLIAAVAAALASGVRRGVLLIALIALPLFAPTAIFGAAACYAGVGLGGVTTGEGQTALLLLAALSLASVALCPFAAAAALKSAAE